jgi:hypothetical protein
VTVTSRADDAALPIVRAAMLEEATDERRWLIDRLWARAGVGILGGAPKCCKSWLGLEMAFAVASHTPCLGELDVDDPGGALVYLAEDALSVVKARLDSICRHRRRSLAELPIDVITAPQLRLDLARDQQRLADAVRRLRPRLLLLDPFVRLHRIDENSAGDVSALLAYLRALQREHDLAIVVTHHARKNGPAGAQAGTALRGSGDLHAWGDSNLYLRRVRDALALTIEHRAAAAPEPLRLALVGDDSHAHLEILRGEGSDDGDDVTAVDLDAAVLHALAAAPLSRTGLRAALRVRSERLGPVLARLAANGRIVREGDRWGAAKVPVPVPVLRQEAERNARPSLR